MSIESDFSWLHGNVEKSPQALHTKYIMEHAAQPSISIHIMENLHNAHFWESRFWGAAPFPSHQTWPLNSDGQLLCCLGYIDLSEIYFKGTFPLPSNGMLFFFVDANWNTKDIIHSVIYQEGPLETNLVYSQQHRRNCGRSRNDNKEIFPYFEFPDGGGQMRFNHSLVIDQNTPPPAGHPDPSAFRKYIETLGQNWYYNKEQTRMFGPINDSDGDLDISYTLLLQTGDETLIGKKFFDWGDRKVLQFLIKTEKLNKLDFSETICRIVEPR